MAYSTIQKRKCKGSCGRMPMMSLNGYCWNCCPEETKEKYKNKQEVSRKNKYRNLAIASRLRADKAEKDELGVTVKENWFLQRRREMKGHCSEPGCNKSTNKGEDNYFRWSVCHIVPKSLVKSVKFHPDNWIELCQEHHQWFDATFERSAKMKCFAEAKKKFETFKYLIPPDELRKINPYLLMEIEQSVSSQSPNNKDSENNES